MTILKYLFSCLLFVWAGGACPAQDTVRIASLLKTGGDYIFRPGEEKKDLDSAMMFLKEALALCNTPQSIKWKNETLKLIGDCYLEGTDLARGKASFMPVIDYYKKTGDKRKEAETWFRLGECVPIRNDQWQGEKATSYEHARVLYHQLGDTLAEAHALKNVADAHLHLGKLDLAETELLQVLVLYGATGFRTLHPTYSLLSTISTLKSSPDKELYYNLEAIKNMEATADTGDLSLVCFDIASNYRLAGLYEKSIPYYWKAFERFKRSESYDFMYVALTGWSISMAALNKAGDALDLFKRMAATMPPAGLWEKVNYQEGLAVCYKKLQQYDKARDHYEEMIRFFEQFQATDFSVANQYMFYQKIIDFYILIKQYRLAGLYLGKLKKAPAGVVHPWIMARVEWEKFVVDSAAGNYTAAIRHFELHTKLNDSIFTATKTRQLEELQIQYETEKKDKNLQIQQKNILLLTEKNNAQQNEVQKSRITRNGVIGGSCVLLLLLLVSYNGYRLKKRSNLQLQAQQKEISSKNDRLQHLIRDNEWLLREVHHRVKNNLQIVMSLLNSQSAYLQDEAALSAVLESQHRVQAMSLIHQKLYKSSNVSSIHMPEYINDLVEYLKDSFNTRQTIYFDQRIEPIYLDVLQAVPIGLILNEVITNALKYAFPHTDQDRITIRLFRSLPDELSLLVCDNGRGLPKNFDISRSHSFGMTLILGLAEDLDGTLTVEDKNGTAIYMTFKNTRIPLPVTRMAR